MSIIVRGLPPTHVRFSAAMERIDSSMSRAATPADDVIVLLTWGDGSRGSLGHGLTTNELLPRVVTSLLRHRLHSVCCGGGATFVRAASGEVYSCGSSGYGLLGQGDAKGLVCVPQRVRGLHGQLSLACGDRHAAAVGAGGDFYMWGEGGNGQLGTEGSVSTPRVSDDVAECARVTAAAKIRLGLQEAKPADSATDSAAHAVGAACGSFHTLVVAKSGALYSWGLKGSPQLGQGRVVGASAAAVQLACGEGSASAAGLAGRTSSFGNPADLSLDVVLGEEAKQAGEGWGTGADPAQIKRAPPGLPARVPVVRSVRSVAAGVGHSAALSAKGRLWLFGANGDGQLGMGHAGGEEYLPKRVPALLSVKVDAVACGAFFTALIIDGGSVLTFGANECGQLGHGGTEPEVQPRLVRALGGNPVATIACGAYHLAALTAAGTLHMCGRNGDGEVGVGDVSGANQPLPRDLPIFGEAGMFTLSLSCGSFHTAAVVRLQRSRLPHLLGRHAAAALEAKAAAAHFLHRRHAADSPLPGQHRSSDSLVASAASPTAGLGPLGVASARRRSGSGWSSSPDLVLGIYPTGVDAEGEGAQESPERAQLFREVQDRATNGENQGHRVRNLDMELDMLHTRLSATVKNKMTVGQAFHMERSRSMFVAAARRLIQPGEIGAGRRANEQGSRRAGLVSPLPGIPRPGQAKPAKPYLSNSASRSTSPTPSMASRRGSNTISLHGSASQPNLSSTSLAAGRLPSRGSHRGTASGEATPVHARGPSIVGAAFTH